MFEFIFSWVEYSDIFKDLKTFNQLWTLVWLPSRCVYSPGASKLINSCVSISNYSTYFYY